MTAPPTRPPDATSAWLMPVILAGLTLALGVWFLATGTPWHGVGLLVMSGLWAGYAVRRWRARSRPPRG